MLFTKSLTNAFAGAVLLLYRVGLPRYSKANHEELQTRNITPSISRRNLHDHEKRYVIIPGGLPDLSSCHSQGRLGGLATRTALRGRAIVSSLENIASEESGVACSTKERPFLAEQQMNIILFIGVERFNVATP